MHLIKLLLSSEVCPLRSSS